MKYFVIGVTTAAAIMFLFFCTEAAGEPGASIIAGGLGVAVTVLSAAKLA